MSFPERSVKDIYYKEFTLPTYKLIIKIHEEYYPVLYYAKFYEDGRVVNGWFEIPPEVLEDMAKSVLDWVNRKFARLGRGTRW
jgi:hypothetical protein